MESAMKTNCKSLILSSGLLAGLSWAVLPAAAAELDPVNPAKTVSLPAIPKPSDAASAKQSARFSAGLNEVVRLTKAGLDEAVILAFIESSSVAYRPSATEILKLRELGVTSPVISALLRRGEALRQRSAEAQREAAARSAASTTQTPTPSSPPPTQQVAPQPTINHTAVVPAVYPAAYPTVVFANSPTYRYPSYYSFGSGRYRNCYYPRSYYSPRSYSSCSYLPRRSYYGASYPRSSLSVGFRGGYFRGYAGFRHCR
jgi:hypothetical protein